MNKPVVLTLGVSERASGLVMSCYYTLGCLNPTFSAVHRTVSDPIGLNSALE